MQQPDTTAYIAYTRCSTDEQGKKGNSHEYQIDGIRRSGLVRNTGIREIQHFQDTVSGTRFDNRILGLDQAYKLCERNRGKIQYIFVYRWDRLGRDVGECFSAVKKFRAIGVELNCPDEWIEYSDPTYPVMLGLKFGMAQGESMRISDRTRDGQHAALMAGVHIGKPPAGYLKADKPVTINGKPRSVCIIDPIRAAIVRDCFERFANGEQRSELFKRYKESLGVGWTQFYEMFQNPFYTGKLHVRPHRTQPATYVEGLHQPIISQELFDRCQGVTQEVNRPRSKAWTLDGSKSGTMFYLKKTIRCDKTGRPMRASVVKGKGARYFAYYHGYGKGSQNILIQKAHAIFQAALADLRILPENAMLIRRTLEAKINDRLENIKKQIDAAQTNKRRASERLEKLRNDYADSQITASEYRDFKKAYEADFVRYDAEVVKLEDASRERDELVFECLKMMESIDTIFMAADEAYKCRIAQAIFPEGIFLDLKRQKVQTPCINSVIFALCGESTSYTHIEIKKPDCFSTNPAKGQSVNEVQTPELAHIMALQGLFAA